MALTDILPWQRQAWSSLIALKPRLPHALLLHGPAGIGKRPFAQAFAEALLCETPMADGMACGTCAACLLMSVGNHPDLRMIVPEADFDVSESEEIAPAIRSKAAKPSNEIKIDQVLALGGFVSISSHRGGRRLIVLAPAEALTAAAANALLKVLEEPPPDTVFVLVADDVDAVLPTIRSRCMLQRAPMPSWSQSLEWLASQALDDAEARLAEAGGAPLAALETEEADPRRLSAPMRAELLTLLSQGAELSGGEIASKIPKDVPLTAAIALFQRWSWDLLGVKAAGVIRYYPKSGAALVRLATAANTEALLRWSGEMKEARATSEHPLNARLAVEAALIRYAEALRVAV